MRALLFSLLALFLAAPFAHAEPEPDFEKLCKPSWETQLEKAKADLVAGLREAVVKGLVSRYEEAKLPISPDWVSFHPQIGIDPESKKTALFYGGIRVEGGGRSDLFWLSNGSYEMERELIDPITFAHKPIYNAIGDLVAVDCLLAKFGEANSRDFQIFNARTEVSVYRFELYLHLPPTVRVNVTR